MEIVGSVIVHDHFNDIYVFFLSCVWTLELSFVVSAHAWGCLVSVLLNVESNILTEYRG